jgi:hypothetical protein
LSIAIPKIKFLITVPIIRGNDEMRKIDEELTRLLKYKQYAYYIGA